MMSDVEYWQEQDRRAAEILPILEQTLVIAQERNLLENTKQGLCYWGDEQTLIYDPESEQLSIVANDSSWQLDWHEGLFIQSAETLITDEHLTQFHELAKWLDTQEVGQAQTIQTEPSQLQADTLLSNAAQLFEYYASQENLAFKFSPNSPEHFYRVQLEEAVYLISRDDETGLYSVQREDETVLSASDAHAWNQMGTWLQQLAGQPPLQAPHAAAPYWEQQAIQANALLLEAQALFDLEQEAETLEDDAIRQSYTCEVENYTIGYTPRSDVFWLERNDERLVSATHYQQHQDSGQSTWHLSDLYDLGNITQEDVQRLREWRIWLTVQAQPEQEQSQQLTRGWSQELPRDSNETQSDYERDR